MDLERFGQRSTGDLVPISGTDPTRGPWSYVAFVPHPLTTTCPQLSAKTYRTVGDARAALAALDSTARRLPNPSLLRRSTLQTEAQSTSALEGTYAPLTQVLSADEDQPATSDLREVLNYVTMADTAFAWTEQGRRLSPAMLCELQGLLVRGTRAEGKSSGRVRDVQVVVGRRSDAPPDIQPVVAARFVPEPPGRDLEANLADLLDWMGSDDHDELDPVVSAAMAHYQFETLHPFNDGNGRVGRLLIVIHLLGLKVLSEPTLTVSPWFESHRDEYYDRLLAVSTDGDWDGFVRFFAAGLHASATRTHARMLELVDVQNRLKDRVRMSPLRAESAQMLVDYAVARPSFTARMIQRDLRLSYARANGLVNQLVALDVLAPIGDGEYRRRFYSPDVWQVLIASPLG